MPHFKPIDRNKLWNINAMIWFLMKLFYQNLLQNEFIWKKNTWNWGKYPVWNTQWLSILYFAFIEFLLQHGNFFYYSFFHKIHMYVLLVHLPHIFMYRIFHLYKCNRENILYIFLTIKLWNPCLYVWTSLWIKRECMYISVSNQFIMLPI